MLDWLRDCMQSVFSTVICLSSCFHKVASTAARHWQFWGKHKRSWWSSSASPEDESRFCNIWNPRTSTKAAANELEMRHHSIVQQTLHFQRVQEMLPANFNSHELFARRFMNMNIENNDFPKYVSSLMKLLLRAIVCLTLTTYTCGRMKPSRCASESPSAPVQC